ncbi:uncharacterized protein [Coffea arabica]|uniref:ATP-dependent DNA helicase n=1 Tax=Coffea arabica TaxID=13443 RepID=A0A6P6UYW6_COFAR
MSEDFLRCSDLTPRKVRKKVLQQISGFLELMGKSIASFGLVPNDLSSFDVENQTRELLAERSITIREEDLNAISLLNEKQRHAFEIISHRIYENKNGTFFLDGPEGTRKSFLYRALLADIRSKGYLALATATSGIATSILPGALNDLLQDLMNSSEIFGGNVVVFGGDFRQTLPVVRRGNQSETINACIINSLLSPSLEKVQLTENMRARLDPSFTDYLLRVGNGTEKIQDDSYIKIPSSILLENSEADYALDNLINLVYPNTMTGSSDANTPINQVILSTKNNSVDEVYDIVISKFPGEAVEYLSSDKTLNPNHQGQYEDFLNSLSPSGLPPHSLILKVNAPIILLRNLDPTEGLCNRTRLICRNLS